MGNVSGQGQDGHRCLASGPEGDGPHSRPLAPPSVGAGGASSDPSSGCPAQGRAGACGGDRPHRPGGRAPSAEGVSLKKKRLSRGERRAGVSEGWRGTEGRAGDPSSE